MQLLRAAVLAFLCVVGLSVAAAVAGAAPLRPGSFDPAFGADGSVISGAAGYGDQVSGAAVEPDGAAVVVGVQTVPGTFVYAVPEQIQFVVQVFDADGQPDTSFGSGGILLGPADSSASSVAVTSDGAILVGAFVAGQSEVLAFTANGSPDDTFGVGGAAVIADTQPQTGITGLYPLSSGQVLVTGQTYTQHSCCGKDFVERISSTGALDPTFGNSGRVLLGFPGDNVGPPLVQTPDGDLIVAGPGNGTSTSVLYRRLPDGDPDPLFGRDGSIVIHTGLVNALALQSDGKILVGDQSLPPSDPPVLSRYDADGALDTSFADRGTLLSRHAPHHADQASAIATQPDGAILYAAGRSVARLNSDGTPDLGFGNDGVVRLPIGVNNGQDGACGDHCSAYNRIDDLAVLPDGAIMAIGDLSEPDILAPSTDEQLDALLAHLVGGGPPKPAVTHVRFTYSRDQPGQHAAKVRYHLSPAARIAIVITATSSGRRHGSTCLPAVLSAQHPRAATCTRRRSTTIHARLQTPGAHAITIPVPAREPVHLTFVITASNPAGTTDARYTQNLTTNA